jgi:hypothetical protein
VPHRVACLDIVGALGAALGRIQAAVQALPRQAGGHPVTGPTLCAIPDCRQRNRHLPTCTDDCLGCLPRLAEDGIVCDQHVRWAAESLAEIIALAPDARAVAAGLVRHGSGGGGKPGSRSPGNDDAMDQLDDALDKIARPAIHIAVRRGMRLHMPCIKSCIKPTPSQAHCSVCHETFGSVSGFDRHRRGGQCLDPTEITGIHRTDTGIWRFDGGQNRADAHSAPSGTPQTAEQPELVPAPYPEALEAL